MIGPVSAAAALRTSWSDTRVMSWRAVTSPEASSVEVSTPSTISAM